MILDEIGSASQYAFLGERFARAFRYLQQFDPSDFQEGRHVLDGEQLFAIHTAYRTQEAEGRQMEAHRRYADIMLMVDGEEAIAWKPTAALKQIQAPYDPACEAMLGAVDDDVSKLILKPGTFSVFLPQDAHCPSLAFRQPQWVKKIIVKVLLDADG